MARTGLARRITRADVARAIDAHWTLADVARDLGVHRATVYRYLARWPDLVDRLQQRREALLDLAEDKLREAIEAGELRAIIFVLSTLGRKRGYVSRVEHATSDSEPIVLCWDDGSPLDVA